MYIDDLSTPLDTSTSTVRQLWKYSKTSFEKNCFSAWASTLNVGLINNMVCLSPVIYGASLTF